MNFLSLLLVINILVLGVIFILLLIGGPLGRKDDFSPVRVGRRSFTVERFTVAMATSVMGVSWLLAWVYFMVKDWEQFWANPLALSVHVTMQLVTGIVLTAAGIGVFRQWKRHKGLFLASMALLVISITSAMFLYGPRGHGDAKQMYLVSFLTLVVGAGFTTMVYVLDRLTHTYDDRLPRRKKVIH